MLRDSVVGLCTAAECVEEAAALCCAALELDAEALAGNTGWGVRLRRHFLVHEGREKPAACSGLKLDPGMHTSAALVRRPGWVERVGEHLLWLAVKQVTDRIEVCSAEAHQKRQLFQQSLS